MRILTTMLLAGAGALALTGAAAAQSGPAYHTMTIQLPGGGVEQIEYTGNVAPRVAIVPVTTLDGGFAPFWAAQAHPVLANFEQISAAMDLQADAMLQQAAAMMNQPGFAAMAPGPNGVWQIDTGTLPPGAQAYSFSETVGPNGVCTQSMTMRANGRVVQHRSGSCGAGGGTPAGITLPNTTPDMAPAPAGTMEVKATPGAGHFQEAMYQPAE